MKPLYRFKLDENTGKILVHEITEYGEGKWSGYFHNNCYWRYKENGQIKYCYRNKLDRFVNGQVYSFDPSLERVANIIYAEINERATKAFKEYTRYSMIQTKMIEANKNDKNRSRQNHI